MILFGEKVADAERACLFSSRPDDTRASFLVSTNAKSAPDAELSTSGVEQKTQSQATVFVLCLRCPCG